MSKYPYTIPRREEILNVLRTSTTALDSTDIAEALFVKHQELKGFLRRIAAMERDGQIRLDEQGNWQLTCPSKFVSGRVQVHQDGYGFLICENNHEDLFLSRNEIQKVMHNDRVLARIIGYDRRFRPEIRIVEVTERANKNVIGRLLNKDGMLIVVPEDKRIGHEILITKNVKKRNIGQVVVVELTEFPGRFYQPRGHVIEVLGNINDPGIEIEIAVRKYGIPYRFSKHALDNAATIANNVSPDDLHFRVDLRDLPFVTIDGEDARDFDDAVYCEPIKIGHSMGFRLIVAIADVSYYVRPGSGLDSDAAERSTSVYFPRRVIPMLPEKLSNGLCSLNLHADRCVLICDIVVTENGEINSYQFYPGVIHSSARLTYTEAAAALENMKCHETVLYSKLFPHLQNLYNVYKSLLIARKNRGAIDFSTVETHIVFNDLGKITKIVPIQRNDAHRLIEECMLAANVCAADFLKRNNHAGLYRIHASPALDRLNSLRTFLNGIGLYLGGGQKPHARDYANLMTQIRDRPDAQMLQTMLLRSMQQATYSSKNIGHFGLAYESYIHFTSPIRRYPDLLTHRAIYAILEDGKYVPKVPDGVVLNNYPRHYKSRRSKKLESYDDNNTHYKTQQNDGIWEELSLHCSENERRADEAERDVELWLKCYFMLDKLGMEYDGIVSGVTSFGIFVQVNTLFIEGLIHVTDLDSDYFQYDEVKNELRGERTDICYRISDCIRIQVHRIDLDARKIYFHLLPSFQ